MGIIQAAIATNAPGSGAVAEMSPWDIREYTNDVTPARVAFTVLTDGRFEVVGNIHARGSADWFLPATPGIGGSYWVRLTQNSLQGDGIGGAALNTWLALTSDRTWEAAAAGGSNAGDGGFFTLEFSTSATGTPIVGRMAGSQLLAWNFFFENPGGA
jgi:hypothetical protein